uniref:RING-type domain-containing protein n=1 Tax=Graphocephala atropunctata TaxID=36148 RepID=A0A1B6KBH9_9HEMI
MPAYGYMGVIGGFIALGVLIWTIWKQEERPQKESSSNFNPGPGYDRPRETSWEDEDVSLNGRRRRMRRSSDEHCTICMEPLSSQPTRRLPCKHICHDKCISKWFEEQKTCPSCRKACY